MRLPLSISTVALLIFVGALGTMGPPEARAGTPYNPDFEFTLAPPLTAGEPSGYEIELEIPNGEAYPFRSVHFLPEEWGVTPGDQIPIGTLVGTVDTDATLGLFNAACNQSLPLHFDLYNASTDSTDVVLYGDGDGDNEQDIAEDEDGNGALDAIDKYPDILVRMFPGMEPIRRFAGITYVAGMPTLVQYLTFAEGTQVPGAAQNVGWPVVAVVSNIGDPELLQKPYAITDYCSPQLSVTSFQGVAEGVPLFTNPAPGSYTVTAEITSMPDADGDTYENTLDTCPLIANLGSPRVPMDGDLDSDGLDGACDPNDFPPSGGTNSDEDFDGFLNRQDNCPLVANGGNEDNQADVDHDYIGDFCDPNPGEANGAFEKTTIHVQVTITGEYTARSGDVDCDGDVTTRDAQVIIRSVVGNPIELPANCPEPGEPVG